MRETRDAQAMIAELQRHYVLQLREKHQRMTHLWAVVQADAGDATSVQALYFLVHQLSGSSGSFGFHALGDVARELDPLFQQWHEGVVPDAIGLRDIGERMGRLVAEISTAMKTGPAMPDRPPQPGRTASGLSPKIRAA